MQTTLEATLVLSSTQLALSYYSPEINSRDGTSRSMLSIRKEIQGELVGDLMGVLEGAVGGNLVQSVRGKKSGLGKVVEEGQIHGQVELLEMVRDFVSRTLVKQE